MHLIEIDGSKLDFTFNTHDDALLKHFLADILSLLVVSLDMFFNPAINVAAINTSNLSSKPPILVLLNLYIAPNQFRPVTQLL